MGVFINFMYSRCMFLEWREGVQAKAENWLHLHEGQDGGVGERF